jgi:phospholipase/lecithinase/hemolysin
MRIWRFGALAAAAVLLLASCGGGDPYVAGSEAPAGAPTTKGSFTAVVSFGDSVSDAGAYTPATSLTGDGKAPYFGGRWTTNASTSTVWVENVAATLGIVITPAEVGWGTSSVKCPAAANPALSKTCTAYGMGGSRVTDPKGYGYGTGVLTVPVVTQIANHLARFGSFKETDLITVFAGTNDIFIQLDAFDKKVKQIQAAAAAGQITPDEAKGALLQAELAAFEALKQAATELAGYVKDQILARGGKYVMVWDAIDTSMTPYGQAQSAQTKQVLIDMADVFNLWLHEGLKGQPVQIVDTNAIFVDVVGNPGKYGLTNVSLAACDVAKISALTGGKVTNGASMFCNGTPGAPYNTLVAGADVETWAWADVAHTSIGGHKAISQNALSLLKSYGWI